MTDDLLTIAGQRLPPPPMTSRQARARGLKVFPSFARCRVDGTNIRTTARGLCVACQEREKAERLARDRTVAAQVRAEVLKTARTQVLRELAAEERQRQRDADKARKDAEKAAARAQRKVDKEAQAKERRRQKAARTRAKNKTAKEATNAAPYPAPSVGVCPPWAGPANCLQAEAAPWD